MQTHINKYDKKSNNNNNKNITHKTKTTEISDFPSAMVTRIHTTHLWYLNKYGAVFGLSPRPHHNSHTQTFRHIDTQTHKYTDTDARTHTHGQYPYKPSTPRHLCQLSTATTITDRTCICVRVYINVYTCIIRLYLFHLYDNANN